MQLQMQLNGNALPGMLTEFHSLPRLEDYISTSSHGIIQTQQTLPFLMFTTLNPLTLTTLEIRKLDGAIIVQIVSSKGWDLSKLVCGIFRKNALLNLFSSLFSFPSPITYVWEWEPPSPNPHPH